jgi:peptidoglycan glycosyltransferase
LRYQLRAAGASTVCPEDGGRIYPAGPAAFYLVGDARTRTNWGAGNSSYIERDEQTRLRGYTVSTVDANGAPQTQRNYGPLVDLLPLRNLPDSAVAETFRREHSVASSIDAGLTLDAARVLNSAIARSGSGKGAIVVMDAETGEVLASVSGPQPPEHTPEATPDQLLDRARYGLYPPGSSFKLVTAAAGLRKDPACAESTFQCSRLEGGRTGAMVRRALIRDDAQDTEPHGEINMQRALVVSCNAWFAAFAVGRVGSNELFRTAAQLGISVARPATAEQLNHLLPQAAYGQGQVVASPLQMARVAAMIANGGSVPPVRWRAGENAEEKRIRILEAPEAQVLGSAMRMAVTEGTGKLALRAPVPVAGKTGTAETGGAASHAWFVGYAPWGPTKGRRIAFAILIENGGYGGTAAAPVAAEVVRAAVERHLIER